MLPTEVRDALLEMLRVGLLRVRSLSEAERASDCFNEANHLHNIPGIVKADSAPALRYYWKVERAEYLASGGDSRAFEDLWTIIGLHTSEGPDVDQPPQSGAPPEAKPPG